MSAEVSGWSLKQVVEAILFASQRPVSTKDLQAILKSAAQVEKDSRVVAFAKIKEPELRAAIDELRTDCAEPSRAYELRETAAGWQLVTKPEFAPWLRQLYPEYRSNRLSAPALETLDGVLQTLLDRGLVKIAGRAEIPGRPLLYETTQHFMDHFGLRNLGELPNAEELRRIRLPVAAAQLDDQRADPKQLSEESGEVADKRNPSGFQSFQTEEKSS